MEDMNQQYEPEEEVGDGAAGGGDAVLLKKGPWTAGEDAILVAYVEKHGEGNWNNLQKLSGLLRCGKSCRLRWANHLRPNLKKGAFTREEERLIIELHAKIGNKWARMAAQLPGRTDNEIKNYWNTRVKRRQRAGLPVYPLDLQIIPPLHSSCLPPQSDTTSLGSSVDSHPHLHHLPSPKKDSRPFNLTNLHKETQTALLLQNAICDLNVPTASAGNHHVQSLKRPAAQTSDANATAKRICVISSLSQGFPMEPDPGINSSLYPNVSGKQAVMSGFYTSFGLHSSPKLELPSGQCVEAAESAGICTPPALSTPFTSFFLSKSATSDPSASNNGLLESLLQESEAKGRNSKQFLQTRDQTIFQMSDKFCVGGESKSYNASTALLGGSAEMEQLLISANLSYRWKHESTTHSSPPLRPVIKVEESSGALACTYATLELSPNSNLSRPDHILVSEWNNMQFDTAHAISWHKETQTESDFLHVVKEVDSGHLGHTTTAADLFWELESCQWNNMPGACQIGDFASDLRRFNSMAEQSGGPRAIF